MEIRVATVSLRNALVKIAGILCGLAAACGSNNGDAKTARAARDTARVLAPSAPSERTSDSTNAAPGSALRAFLEASLETSPPTETNDLMSCVPDGQTDTYVTLAHYRVLQSTGVGDTARAASEVVTVAEEVGHPSQLNRFRTTVRIRTDTLHWTMVRDSGTRRWGVCGYPSEGVGFGHYGADSDTEWRPHSSSWAQVRQIADSLHAMLTGHAARR